MLQETHDREEIIERVAALDIGKAELMCCVRVPDEDHRGRRLQEVQSDGSSPWRAGSGSTGGRSGETRSPSASNGLMSHPVIRDSGSRRSASAAATAWW